MDWRSRNLIRQSNKYSLCSCTFTNCRSISCSAMFVSFVYLVANGRCSLSFSEALIAVIVCMGIIKHYFLIDRTCLYVNCFRYDSRQFFAAWTYTTDALSVLSQRIQQQHKKKKRFNVLRIFGKSQCRRKALHVFSFSYFVLLLSFRRILYTDSDNDDDEDWKRWKSFADW